MSTSEEDKLRKLLEEGCWIKCRANGNILEMCKLRNEYVELIDSENDASTSQQLFEDITQNSSEHKGIQPPLLDNEKYCTVLDWEEVNDNFIPEVTIKVEPHDAPIISHQNSDEIYPLFISQIVSSTEHQGLFKFENINFKTVMIFGVIVEISTTPKKDIIVVDDGTGELTCFLERKQNECVIDSEDNPIPDKDLNVMRCMLLKTLREHEDTLPTFDKLKMGDRVCLSGDVTYHNDNFHLFVQKLERTPDVQAHVTFLNRVFELYEKKVIVPTTESPRS